MKRRYNTDRQSFISISIAWAFGLVCFSVTQVIKNGRTEDFEPVIFWSLIFTLTAWLIFIRFPLNRLDPSSIIFNKFIFPLCTTIYGLSVFTLLIGWGFVKTDFYEVFIQAGTMGLIFGLVYTFVTSRGLKTKKEKILGYLTPVLILTVFLWLFPTIFPSVALRFMPDSIECEIVKQTIKEFKPGDDFAELRARLPGRFDDRDSLELNTIAGLGGLKVFGYFHYALEVHCGKIVSLQYSETEHGYKDFRPIGGRVDKEPCR